MCLILTAARTGPLGFASAIQFMLLDFAGGGAQRVVVAYDHVVFAVDSEDVERLAGGESQSFALADGEIGARRCGGRPPRLFVDNITRPA